MNALLWVNVYIIWYHVYSSFVSAHAFYICPVFAVQPSRTLIWFNKNDLHGHITHFNERPLIDIIFM